MGREGTWSWAAESEFSAENSGMEGWSRLRGCHLGQGPMVGTCLLSAEGREPGCLGALTSLLPTGLRAAAGAVPEEHGVEILPEHQPRMEAAGMGQVPGDWVGVVRCWKRAGLEDLCPDLPCNLELIQAPVWPHV